MLKAKIKNLLNVEDKSAMIYMVWYGITLDANVLPSSESGA